MVYVYYKLEIIMSDSLLRENMQKLKKIITQVALALEHFF